MEEIRSVHCMYVRPFGDQWGNWESSVKTVWEGSVWNEN